MNGLIAHQVIVNYQVHEINLVDGLLTIGILSIKYLPIYLDVFRVLFSVFFFKKSLLFWRFWCANYRTVFKWLLWIHCWSRSNWWFCNLNLLWIYELSSDLNNYAIFVKNTSLGWNNQLIYYDTITETWHNPVYNVSLS